MLGSLLVLASRLIRALVLAVVSSASGVSVTGEEIQKKWREKTSARGGVGGGGGWGEQRESLFPFSSPPAVFFLAMYFLLLQ